MRCFFVLCVFGLLVSANVVSSSLGAAPDQLPVFERPGADEELILGPPEIESANPSTRLNDEAPPKPGLINRPQDEKEAPPQKSSP